MICIKLSQLLKGVCIVKASSDFLQTEIKDIKEDSRLIQSGDMFIAMNGTVCDGEDYIAQSISNGAVCIISESKGDPLCEISGVCFVQVHNVRRACAVIWSNYYGNPERYLKLIGVTGTNGKTTVCKMIKQIFDYSSTKCAIIGTVNNGIGTDMTKSDMTTPIPKDFFFLLFQYLQKGAEVVVLEASSHALRQERLAPCTFDVSVLTNITSDHMDFHKTMEDYVSSKCKLFTQSKTVILNGDDPYAKTVAKRTRGYKKFCTLNENGEIRASNVKDFGKNGISFLYNGKTQVKLPLAGAFNVMNAVQALAVCEVFGVSCDIGAQALEKMQYVKGRCEILQFEESIAPDYSVIIDFAHTPDALENILKSCRIIAEKRVIVVFGCGGDRDKTKRPEMGRIASRMADISIITCDNSRSERPDAIISDILKGVDKHSLYTVLENRTDAIYYALDTARKGDVVLLAGKGHEEYEINSNGKIPYSERSLVQEYLKRRFTEKG